jgi:hypothetical protein
MRSKTFQFLKKKHSILSPYDNLTFILIEKVINIAIGMATTDMNGYITLCMLCVTIRSLVNVRGLEGRTPLPLQHTPHTTISPPATQRYITIT